MNPDRLHSEPFHGKSASYVLLERLTALVLFLVLFTLAGIVILAWQPELGQWITLELQVVLALAIVASALILVSVVAFLHTR